MYSHNQGQHWFCLIFCCTVMWKEHLPVEEMYVYAFVFRETIVGSICMICTRPKHEVGESEIVHSTFNIENIPNKRMYVKVEVWDKEGHSNGMMG